MAAGVMADAPLAMASSLGLNQPVMTPIWPQRPQVPDEKITDIKAAFEADAFGKDGVVVRRGKKNFRKIVVK